MLYADSVTCDSSVPALEDITFTLEMYNPNSEGKPTIHCGCDETGNERLCPGLCNNEIHIITDVQIHSS